MACGGGLWAGRPRDRFRLSQRQQQPPRREGTPGTAIGWKTSGCRARRERGARSPGHEARSHPLPSHSPDPRNDLVQRWRAGRDRSQPVTARAPAGPDGSCSVADYATQGRKGNSDIRRQIPRKSLISLNGRSFNTRWRGLRCGQGQPQEAVAVRSNTDRRSDGVGWGESGVRPHSRQDQTISDRPGRGRRARGA